MNLDEERQICERYYSRAIADATSDEEELAIATTAGSISWKREKEREH